MALLSVRLSSSRAAVCRHMHAALAFADSEALARWLRAAAGMSCKRPCGIWAIRILLLLLLQTQRLRFDFNLPRGVTPEEIHEVEQLVNSWIQQDHSLVTHVVPLQEAKDKGELQSAACLQGVAMRADSQG